MSERPKILVLADAGATVGGGHVMRCLTLAAALEQAGARCAFAASPAAASILDRFAPADLARIEVADAAPLRLASLAADAARAWGAHAAVVDHYGFGPGEEALLRTAVGRLLVVDDLRRGHLCDLVLDSNLGRRPADYPGVESLIGPTFALVRGAFAKARATALARRAQAPRRLLLSLGLTDVGAVTGQVAQMIAPVLDGLLVDIVVGEGAPSLAALRAMAQADRRVTLHVDAADMAALTSEADIAVGAGGSSAWERCCLGLPGVTLILADNQRENTQALADQGATLAIDATHGDVSAALLAGLSRLRDDASARQALSAASAALCDGEGAMRVAERLIDLV